jgi:ferredoxin
VGTSIGGIPLAIRYPVSIEGTDASFPCDAEKPVLVAMAALGRSDIAVGCRGGGCGVCRIEVMSGTYTRAAMSRAHVSREDETRGIVLACRIRPTSALRIRVIPRVKTAAVGSTRPQPR